MSRPLVSIIIINYKTYEYLYKCLSSINKSLYPNIETIVYDNSYIPKKNKFLINKFPHTKFISDSDNLGFGLANNIAVKQALGKYIFFLNPDTKIAPNAIALLIKKIQSNINIGICGSSILSYDGKKTHHCGIGIDILGFPLNSKKIFYVEGSALLIKKELFLKLGGFDPKYFMFHEDVDLCWRCWLSGQAITTEPKAKVFHQIGAISGGTTPSNKKPYLTSILRRYYSERNNLRTIIKNYQFFTLFFILPLYLVHNLFEFIFFIFTLQPKLIYYYIKGYVWNLINLPNTLKYRQQVQSSRQISDWQILSKMNFTSGKFINLLKLGVPKIK